MSRSGYSDDCDDMWGVIRWRGAVQSAIRGKRGQAFLREMLSALDALPEPRLDAGVFTHGGTCALGAVALRRGLDVSDLELDDDEGDLGPSGREAVAARFGIPRALAQEIMFENDEGRYGETPEQRYARVRRWVVARLAEKERA